MMPEIRRRFHMAGPKTLVISEDEQQRKVHDAIAQRAYQIYEERGSLRGHEDEHWRQAESQLLKRVCCGVTTVNGDIWIEMDAGCFQEGSVEVWLAPRRVTICGRPASTEFGGLRDLRVPNTRLGFRIIELSVETEPLKATARFRGRSLELTLTRAVPKDGAGGETAAKAA
jgi:hypothetical protein